MIEIKSQYISQERQGTSTIISFKILKDGVTEKEIVTEFQDVERELTAEELPEELDIADGPYYVIEPVEVQQEQDKIFMLQIEDGVDHQEAIREYLSYFKTCCMATPNDLTVTDDLIVNGDIDLEGAIDVNGTANLDVVDIDGAVNIAAATTVATDNKIQFRDTAIYINSSADGQLDLVADTEIQIAATTIDIDGAINASGEIIAASLDISGNVDVDGTLETDALSIASTTITATAAELNFSDGVTSNIQTQLDTKATTGKAIAMALVFG